MSRLCEFINTNRFKDCDLYNYFLNPNISLSELNQITNKYFSYWHRQDYTNKNYNHIIQSKHLDIESIMKLYNNESNKIELIIDESTIVELNKDELNWGYISQYSNITLDIIQNNKEIPWDYKNLLANSNLTEELSLYVLDKLIAQYKIQEACYYCGQEPGFICSCYDFTVYQIFDNPNLSIDFLESLLKSNKYTFMDPFLYSINYLVTNPNFKPEMIFNPEYSSKKKDNTYSWLSQNPNLTFDFICANKDELWDWDWLSMHPNIKYEHIYNNHNLPWKIHIFWSNNKNITIENLEKHKSEKEIRLYFFYNTYIPIEFILANLDLKWNWNVVASNKYLKIKHLKLFPELLSYPTYLANKQMTFNRIIYRTNVCNYITESKFIINGFKRIISGYIQYFKFTPFVSGI